VHASKGLELPSLLRLSEVIGQELTTSGVAVLSGPTHAEEVGRGSPTAAVVACSDAGVAATFQQLLHGQTFRVYTSGDIVGVELCHMAGVHHLCLFHHEPVSSDETIAKLLVETQRYEEISRKGNPLRVTAAYDGMEIRL